LFVTLVAYLLFLWCIATFLGTSAFFGTKALTKDFTNNHRAKVLGFFSKNSLLTLRVNNNLSSFAAIKAVFARKCNGLVNRNRVTSKGSGNSFN